MPLLPAPELPQASVLQPRASVLQPRAGEMPDEPDRAAEMPAGPMASPLGAPQMTLPAPRAETASEHEGSIGPSSSLTRAAGHAARLVGEYEDA